MRQILFRIPIPGTDHLLTLYGYGAMMCLGFLVAIWVAAWRAKRLKQSPDIAYNLSMLCFFGGLLGARLFFVVQYYDQFSSPWDLLKIWQGGLTYYGGFVLATLAVMGYLVAARLPVLFWLDIMAPSAALGLAFGRMGCFLNGCCYGDVCPARLPGLIWPPGTIAWHAFADPYLASIGLKSVVSGGGAAAGAAMGGLVAAWQAPALNPSQLYSMINALGLFALLHIGFRHKRRHGQIILAFMLLYGISRFLEECLRADEARAYLLGLPTMLQTVGLGAWAGRLPLLTISQNVAIILAGAALAGLWLLARSRRPELLANNVPAALPALEARGAGRHKR